MANGQAPTYPCANMCHFGFLCVKLEGESVVGRMWLDVTVSTVNRERSRSTVPGERERFVVWELS